MESVDYLGFSNFSYRPNKEAFVSAKSYMSTYAMEGKGADAKIVPSKMQVSYGELSNAKNIKLELLDKMDTELSCTLKFSWENDWHNPEIYGARPDENS